MRISDWSSDVCSSDLGDRGRCRRCCGPLTAEALLLPLRRQGEVWRGVVTDRDDPNGTPPQPSLPSQGREQRLAASAAPAGPLRTQESGRAVRGLFNVAATVADNPARLPGDAPALLGPLPSASGPPCCPCGS